MWTITNRRRIHLLEGKSVLLSLLWVIHPVKKQRMNHRSDRHLQGNNGNPYVYLRSLLYQYYIVLYCIVLYCILFYSIQNRIDVLLFREIIEICYSMIYPLTRWSNLTCSARRCKSLYYCYDQRNSTWNFFWRAEPKQQINNQLQSKPEDGHSL